MANEMDTQRQSKQTLGRVRELLRKHSVEDPNKANEKRERFLALLKRRYGYTNEVAVDELERLLKQFYRTNRSLGIHRARTHLEHPPAE